MGKMKTTDGHEAKKGHYYYLENGQNVILEECVVKENSDPVYLVTPFYEGESMSVNGNGGTHNEVFSPFEVHGEQTLVRSIFKNAPLEKLDERYKDKLKQIELLVLSYGGIKRHSDELKSLNFKFERDIKESKIFFDRNQESKKQVSAELEELKELVNKKRRELSALEDSISSVKDDDEPRQVTKEELQRLRKREFELECLESGGVDNWNFYGESLIPFIERYPNE